MDTLEKQIKFFNIFKEVATNNVGIIHGFKNWVKKMDFITEEKDLLIKLPPVLVKRGGYEYISKSRRREEIDNFMKRKKYTYIEYVIKMTCQIYAASIEKTVGGFHKKGRQKGE